MRKAAANAAPRPLAQAGPGPKLEFDTVSLNISGVTNRLVIRSMPSALDALNLLKDGGLKTGAEWRAAHEVCQGREGNPDYDWVHALCHAIEGDDTNAEYWYRRAGQKRHSRSPELEWRHIHDRLADSSI